MRMEIVFSSETSVTLYPDYGTSCQQMALFRATGVKTPDTANIGIREAGCEGNGGGERKGECNGDVTRILEREGKKIKVLKG
jgi:hypothetical protein